MNDLQRLKDTLSKCLYKMTASEAKTKDICVQCKEEALPKCYSDAGRREYNISGLCEECFDTICREER